MTDKAHVQELLEKYFDQIATDAELAELNQLLSADSAVADDLVRMAEFDAALRAENVASLSIAIPVTKPASTPPSGRRRWAWLSAAAVLFVVGSGVFWFFWNRPEVLPLDNGVKMAEVESGRLLIDSKEQSHVPLHERVEVLDEKPAIVKMIEGARTELSPASTAIFHGRMGDIREVVELIQGEGTFRVPKGQGQFRVQTIAGNVTALGTEFKVKLRLPEKAKDDRKKTMPIWLLEVDVSEGVVEVETWKEKTKLTAPARQVFETERVPDLRGVVRSYRREKTATWIEVEVQGAEGPAQVRTLRIVRTTRINRDGNRLIGKLASVWFEVGSQDTAAWIVGD